MKLTRAVLDTNVFISALLSDGTCRAILRLAKELKFIGVTSPQLLKELSNKLISKFRYSKAETNNVLADLDSVLVTIHSTIEIDIQKDKADNRVLEAAVAGGCSFIVTGDKDLLTLEQYQSVKIVTPRQFLDQIEQSKQ